MKLKDKVAIVTGGARGIGKSACLELAKEGARIAVNYVKSKEKADEVVKEIKALGSDAVSVQADVSNEADVEKLVSKTLEAFGRIDILVNNAGVLGHTDGMKFDKKVWDSVMGTNLMGALHCIQHAAKPMLEQKSGV
ncbi:MAG: SDR family NAD(P)-dependent oxidoreductase, partial [Candidatus Aenigmatarchaeota archaeon]